MRLEARRPQSTMDEGGNWPVYDERGRRMVIRECCPAARTRVTIPGRTRPRPRTAIIEAPTGA